MDERDRERPIVEEDARSPLVERETTVVTGGGGGGALAAVVLVLALLVLLFLFFGGYLSQASDEVGINVNVDAPDVEMPDVDVPEVTPAQPANSS